MKKDRSFISWGFRIAVVVFLAGFINACGDVTGEVSEEEFSVEEGLQSEDDIVLAALSAFDNNKVPGRHIVILKEGVPAGEVGRAHGVVPDVVFNKAINGFAAKIPDERLKALQEDPRVNYIEPDRVVSVLVSSSPEVGAAIHENGFETVTTGIDRIDADLNPRTDVSTIGIAIIDTGIWLNHVDLNIAGNVSFVSGTKSGSDDNGHGTHCAGIAAAKSNDNKGVRGVAPNAKLYAVKVLNRQGSGYLSWIIKGVDWVTANAASKGIKVANMSLGFSGTSASLNTAITNSVAAGVTYVVAAGNEDSDAGGFGPANHPSVVTVSAMGDSDGECGGTGADTSYGSDDTFASFSNFGSMVEIAAPGVDILSTWKGDKQNPGGLYASISGTSMASPHVAGAVAQYLASNPGKSPSLVRTALINAGVSQSADCIGNGDGGFGGDVDLYAEPLVYAKDL